MSDSQFDEIFKNQLPGYESPVPDDMWERIIRKKDKDRKGFFFFFRLLGFFVLGFGFAYILLFGINKKPAIQEGQKISSGKDIAVPATPNTKAIDPNLAKAHSLRKETSQPVLDSLQKTHVHKAYTNSNGSMDSVQRKYKQKGYTNSTKLNGIKPAEIPPTKSKKNSVTPLQKEAGAAGISNLADQKANPTSSSNSNSLTVDSAKNAVIKNSEPGPKPITADSTIKPTAKKSDSVKKVIEGKWSLDLYASPDYPIIYGEPWVGTKLSYTVGLRINRSFGTHFSGRIGIQFSQINFNLTDSNAFDTPYNLKSLDLPVLAGYSWGNETLGMTINTGVVFNLYSWQKGGWVNYFKTNTGLSLYLGFNVKKQINDRIDIFTEPYYRYRLSSMTVSTVYYGKFIDVAGLSFGVRYHFKK